MHKDIDQTLSATFWRHCPFVL